jgi:hypothetical protein
VRSLRVEHRLQLLARQSGLLPQRAQLRLHPVEAQLRLGAEAGLDPGRHGQVRGQGRGLDGLRPRDLGRDAGVEGRRLLHVLRARGAEAEQRAHLLGTKQQEHGQDERPRDEQADQEPGAGARPGRGHAPADRLQAVTFLLAGLGHLARPGIAEAGMPVAAA